MAADVQKSAHLAAAVADDQNRVLAHIGGEEVAGFRDLAFVAQIQPAAGEDPLQFLFVDIRLDKDAAADTPIVGVDQSVQIPHHPCLLMGSAGAANRLPLPFAPWPGLSRLSSAASPARSIPRRPRRPTR